MNPWKTEGMMEMSIDFPSNSIITSVIIAVYPFGADMTVVYSAKYTSTLYRVFEYLLFVCFVCILFK